MKLEDFSDAWKRRIETDSQLFADSDDAAKRLLLGYGRIIHINDRLVELAGQNTLTQDEDFFLSSLRFLLNKRKKSEKEARHNARYVFRLFNDFEPDSQLECLSQFFTVMPDPRAESIESLRKSLAGKLQVPSYFIKTVYLACSHSSQQEYEWTPEEFSKSINRVLKSYTSLTGSDGINQAVLRKKTVSGSYEGGKRR